MTGSRATALRALAPGLLVLILLMTAMPWAWAVSTHGSAALTPPMASGLGHTVPPFMVGPEPSHLGSAPALPMVSATFWVNFTEGGLPAGTLWNVTLNGTTLSATTTMISFLVANGTMNYSIASPPGWHASPAGGNVTVDGTALSLSTTFSQVVYTVSIDEVGLPSGTDWGITLGGTLKTGTSSSLTYSEVNGTYLYALSDVPGWRTTPEAGSVGVAGAPVTETFTWTRTIYSVTFTESGLPSSTLWNVTLNGTSSSTSLTSLAFSVENGTLKYSVWSIAGWHTTPAFGSVKVNGSSVTLTPVFVAVVYAVTFKEVGLTSGTSWSVTLGGTLESSTTTSLVFSELNGTYSYALSDLPGWHASVESGSVVLSGVGATISLSWSRVTYTVTFGELGLPSGTSWEVTLGGTSQLGATSSFAFAEPNGTFSYTVSNVPGWRASHYGGSVDIQAAPVNVSVSWTPTVYTVTFQESGLPNMTAWMVTMAESAQSSQGTTIPFSVGNGTDDYSVAEVTGYAADPGSGQVVVSGSSLTVLITFSPVIQSFYSVTFTESGLPSGVAWNVTLNGVGESGSSLPITFSVVSGSYTYTVANVPGWRADAYSGIVRVAGEPTSVAVLWTPAEYTITYTEKGLPPGTPWTLIVDGVSSMSSQAAINETFENGTYSYTTYAGQTYTTPSGSTVVDGAPVTVTITFRSVGGSSGGSGNNNSSGGSGRSGGTGSGGGSHGSGGSGNPLSGKLLSVPISYWALAAILVVVLLAMLFLISRRQRGGGGWGSEPPTTEVKAWAPVGYAPPVKSPPPAPKAAKKKVSPKVPDQDPEPGTADHLPPGMDSKSTASEGSRLSDETPVVPPVADAPE